MMLLWLVGLRMGVRKARVLQCQTTLARAIPGTAANVHGYEEKSGRCVLISLSANAYPATRGSARQCVRGYECIDNRCSFIVVPTNAYLDDMGERGFRKQGPDCIALRVPANALNSGDDWSCEARYRERDGACQVVAER